MPHDPKDPHAKVFNDLRVSIAAGTEPTPADVTRQGKFRRPTALQELKDTAKQFARGLADVLPGSYQLAMLPLRLAADASPLQPIHKSGVKSTVTGTTPAQVIVKELKPVSKAMDAAIEGHEEFYGKPQTTAGQFAYFAGLGVGQSGLYGAAALRPRPRSAARGSAPEPPREIFRTGEVGEEVLQQGPSSTPILDAVKKIFKENEEALPPHVRDAIREEDKISKMLNDVFGGKEFSVSTPPMRFGKQSPPPPDNLQRMLNDIFSREELKEAKGLTPRRQLTNERAVNDRLKQMLGDKPIADPKKLLPPISMTKKEAEDWLRDYSASVAGEPPVKPPVPPKPVAGGGGFEDLPFPLKLEKALDEAFGESEATEQIVLKNIRSGRTQRPSLYVREGRAPYTVSPSTPVYPKGHPYRIGTGEPLLLRASYPEATKPLGSEWLDALKRVTKEEGMDIGGVRPPELSLEEVFVPKTGTAKGQVSEAAMKDAAVNQLHDFITIQSVIRAFYRAQGRP